MNDKEVVQLGLSFLSIFSVVLGFLSKNKLHNCLAPFVGLSAQPFWIAAAFQQDALGQKLVAVVFTGVYIATLYRRWDEIRYEFSKPFIFKRLIEG